LWVEVPANGFYLFLKEEEIEKRRKKNLSRLR
jgi:hypothetical protein